MSEESKVAAAAALSDDEGDTGVVNTVSLMAVRRVRRYVPEFVRTEAIMADVIMRGSSIVFPENIADQAHAASIAELVKRGSASVGMIADEDFDSPEFIASGATSDPLVAWKEPAELSEREHYMKQELDNDVKEALKTAAKRRKEAETTTDKVDVGKIEKDAVEQS